MPLKHMVIFGFLCVLCVALLGCATIFKGTTQEIEFNTRPDGASVVIGGQESTTPASILLEKGHWEQEAIVTLEGFEQTKVTISGSIEPLYWLNLLTPYGLGFLVDIITGAWLRYDDTYLVPLNPQG